MRDPTNEFAQGWHKKAQYHEKSLALHSRKVDGLLANDQVLNNPDLRENLDLVKEPSAIGHPVPMNRYGCVPA